MAKATKTVEPEQKPSQQEQQEGTSIKRIEFDQVDQQQAGPAIGQLDLLLDMEVPISVILGQTELPIHKILKLGPGSIIPLGRPVDAPVELYLQGVKFAEADLVVVEDGIAVRIRQIIDAPKKQQDR
ncbi:MAG: FliM/FliN family flagellar motor C-terminal domain-containing protein [Sedimentisphaerales bacterium]|nr:FliM/FliN family flagellar motor C-terminal domain-containing protein [Sedimentisphaerales bacterium]